MSAPGAERPAQLHGAAPNPFNPRTTISFSLSAAGPVRVVVYDVVGRVVATLADGSFSPGTHELMWSGRDDAGRQVASGVYLCKLEAGAHVETARMILLK
jgi:flagellar hook assembly protein FlgD